MEKEQKNRRTLAGFLRAAMCLAMMLCVGLMAVAQGGGGVRGTVISASDNQPIPGVNVILKGTTQGTITDFDGNFSINASAGDVLVLSFLGYESQEIVCTGQSDLGTISLEEEASDLDEVVVVGYGVQKKKLVTGATVQVKGEDIAKLNTTSPLQAMQGQTPGVSISSTSGQPGSDMKVTIRGLGTVGDASPLYLIDGIGGDISSLNPSDIESIDVLKDAASAAIYGAQAANGVVLITTKKGKEGKSQISFDAYYGVQSVARTAKTLNAKEYMVIMDEQAVNSGNAVYDWTSFESIYDADGNVYDTDWVAAMFKDNAKTQSYSLSITGGSPTSTYALSGGYMAQEGIVGGKDVSNYARFNFRINSEHKVYGDVLKVGEQVSFVYVKSNGISVGNQYNNTLRSAFNTSPIVPIYSDNNVYGNGYNDTSNSDWYNGDGNPYGAMMTCNNNLNKNASFSGNVYADLQPIKNLHVKTVFGVTYNSNDYRYYKPLYQFSVYDLNTNNTSVTQSANNGMTMVWSNTASYDFKLDTHAFSALIGMESSQYRGTYMSASGGNLKDGFDDWEHAYVSNTSSTTPETGLGSSGSPNDESKTVSYFARLGWNWKETYMVNATFRADGSSKFASGHRYGYFPSVSAGWTLTNESFMSSTETWLNYLKLRASWGQVGNQNISSYQYEAPITTSTTNYLFGTSLGSSAHVWGAYPSRLANEEIKWETSEQTNIGIDARMLDSRLGLTADFYIKNTRDWLVQAPVLATSGAEAPYINGGNVKNTGLELALSWNDRIAKDFSYTVGLNGALNKNKVGEIPTEDGIIHGTTNELYDNAPEFYRAENGKPIGYFWGYKTNGIFQNQKEINNWISAGNGVLQSNVAPGDVRYVDVNHDGVIDEDDKVNLGSGMPSFTFGFNLGINFKGFDFSVVGNGAVGQKIVQTYRNHSSETANYMSSILQRWTGEGTSNFMPRVTKTNINWQFSDLYIHNGNYTRISNVTLGYDFAQLIGVKQISQCRLYVQAQNLATFTKYDGMDPEIGYGPDGDNGESWVSGVDVGYYPRPRTLLVGLNLKF